MSETKMNIGKTKTYKLFAEFMSNLPEEQQKKAEAFEEELYRIIIAHMIFVWGVKTINDLIEEFDLEEGSTVTLKPQVEALSKLLHKVKSLNNYYYKKA
jgi:hypothetical protein